MKTPRLFVRFVRLPLLWLLALLLCGVPPSRANETVRQVQEELRKRNLYFGDIDGRITPQVAAALRRYQKRKGFDPTGEPDETTLRSLNLLPALPLTAEPHPAATAVPPLPGPASPPWPDITVLRSDAARRNPPLPGADDADGSPAPAAATPAPLPATPGPPPAAARRQRPTPDEVRAFLSRYLQAGQTNDTPGELAFYADHVDYFDEGVVDRHFIEIDVTRYDRRWPQRRFTLLEPLTLSEPPDGDPDKFVAHFRYAFANKGPRYSVEGKADSTFTLHGDSPGGLRIIGMKEQRVREK